MMPFFFLVWDPCPKHVRLTLYREAHKPQTRYLEMGGGLQ